MNKHEEVAKRVCRLVYKKEAEQEEFIARLLAETYDSEPEFAKYGDWILWGQKLLFLASNWSLR